MFPFPNPQTASVGFRFVASIITGLTAGGSAPAPIAALGGKAGDILVLAARRKSATLSAPDFSTANVGGTTSVPMTVGVRVLTTGDISSPPIISETGGAQGIQLCWGLYRGAGSAALRGGGTSNTETVLASYTPAANTLGAVVCQASDSADVGSITSPSGFVERANNANLVRIFDNLKSYTGGAITFIGTTPQKALYAIEMLK